MVGGGNKAKNLVSGGTCSSGVMWREGRGRRGQHFWAVRRTWGQDRPEEKCEGQWKELHLERSELPPQHRKPHTRDSHWGRANKMDTCAGRKQWKIPTIASNTKRAAQERVFVSTGASRAFQLCLRQQGRCVTDSPAAEVLSTSTVGTPHGNRPRTHSVECKKTF